MKTKILLSCFLFCLAIPLAGWGEELSSLQPQPAGPHVVVEINIPAKELSLIENEKVIARYPVAIGQLWYKSIVMEDEIKVVEWNPWWYPPPSPWAAGEKITPPGPHNPLGPVKMPLGRGIRVHGTNKDKSVGTAASHGCFRMHNEDAVKLGWYLQTHFSDQTDPKLLETYSQNRRRTYRVPLTQPVLARVIYEPVVVEGSLINFYPDIYGKVRNWFEKIETALQAKGVPTHLIQEERVNEIRRALKKEMMTIRVADLMKISPPLSLSPMSQNLQETTVR